MFILLISNHTVFLVQFGINLHLWVFQKAKLHSPKRLVQFQLFEKLTRANEFQIEREKPYDYLYKVISSTKDEKRSLKTNVCFQLAA